MQFEDFDKKIKEAADRHHPPYDEQAWTKMEKLLDKHLPEEKDDRRRILFMLFLFLGLTGAGLFIFKPWKTNKQVTERAPQTKVQTSAPSSNTVFTTKDEQSLKTSSGSTTVQELPASTSAGADGLQKNAVNDLNEAGRINRLLLTETSTNEKNNKSNLTPVKKNERKEPGLTFAAKSNKKTDKKNVSDISRWKQTDPVSGTDKINGLRNEPVTDQKTKNLPTDITEGRDATITSQSSPVVTDNTKNQPVDNTKNQPADNTTQPGQKSTANTTTPGDKKEELVKNDDKKTKERKKKAGFFFFSFSAGPDISFVKNNKAGEIKPVIGAGLGYTYNNRLTLRTGFYSSRKVYTANANAYDPPAAFYSLYPYLEKVDANCKIYEIPVSLSYQFGKKTSRNWFVSAGLSTFLMKEETYNYYYKYTPQGNTYTNEWSIKDKNSHFFSVATLSGGYRKDLSKRVTLTAEPYLKIPVGGVGYGKVKLNSGGVLFTIGVKPF